MLNKNTEVDTSKDNEINRFESSLNIKKHIVEVATGREKADTVLKNATYLNVFTSEMKTADIAIAGEYIAGIGDYQGKEEIDMSGKLVLPGFIDGHIHLESAIVSPKELTKALLPHGTTTLITDPHEITNVMGKDGINYMLQATEGLPLEVKFMIPSCVPSTPFDESGAVLNYEDIKEFYNNPRVLGLAEFMNFVGVVNGDDQCLKKLTSAEINNKQIDGHAPMLKDKSLNAYIASGVNSDHECYDLQDAIDKLERGQHIMIREGTAAQNLTALIPLITEKYENRCLFCVDDRHPNDLLEKGHIDYICKKAISLGADPILTSKIATYNAAQYFRLPKHGAIAPGYYADFAIIDNFENFQVKTVIKHGKTVYNSEVLPFKEPKISADLIKKSHDTFHLKTVTEKDFPDLKTGIIGMINGELLTENRGTTDHVDTAKDILKIAVVERHKNTNHIGIGYLQGYGLKRGAVATSISHDSHNIIVVGTNSKDMAYATNEIIKMHGGITVIENEKTLSNVKLEIAGLMTDTPIEPLNKSLERTKSAAYQNGTNKGIDPFMTLSFMALPVIPTLRITTQGVFDVEKQKYLN